MIEKTLYKIWYQGKKHWLNLILIPLSYLYGLYLKVARMKRCEIWEGRLTQLPTTLGFCNASSRLRKLHCKPYASSVPIVVIGNLTVGGSGKTPAILTLIECLQKQGFKPGVISRGYPISPKLPILLNAKSLASEVGDEPLLIFHRMQVPVCVCRDRVAAIKLLESQEVNVILSDDGLQNFSFQHDIEVVLFDSRLKFGNERLLPAGPLRESLNRLRSVDFVVEKSQGRHPGQEWSPCNLTLSLSGTHFLPLSTWQKNDQSQAVSADYFKHKKLIVITAIAHPENFFKLLESLGLKFEKHAFNDHYAFAEADFVKFQDCEIIMTEKDAIKCLSFAKENFWCLPLIGEFSEKFLEKFLQKLQLL